MGGSSACSGACVNAWPPFTVSGSITPPDGLTGTLATIQRDDGSSQVTYNGMPLYKFSGDRSPGDMKGQGITSFGGSWSIATP
jgi:predicted lipoprotein with Yx(FWY)xxD motif